ncbi:MAG: hypothetical protein H7Y05_13125 [Steroidobacteraceae bacterium]|nr:hypothetical protein [Deltaproteobacteria bacterium]
MTAGEELELSSCKVLHLDLSAFPQTNGLDINPRNDKHRVYHEENRATVQAFCRYANPEKPRYIFIIANRAHILRTGTHDCRLDVTETPTKDKSWKIVDLLRAVEECGHPVQIRLCRRTPQHGCNSDVFRVAASVAYELQPLSGNDS